MTISEIVTPRSDGKGAMRIGGTPNHSLGNLIAIRQLFAVIALCLERAGIIHLPSTFASLINDPEVEKQLLAKLQSDDEAVSAEVKQGYKDFMRNVMQEADALIEKTSL